jgi:photosystem II stability/assembly factor-like uncharacterized protein
MSLQTPRRSTGKKILCMSLLLGSSLVVHAATIDKSAAPAPADSASPFWQDPSNLPAEILPRVNQGLFTGMVHIESGFVAVGERGQIVLSSDGTKWKQAEEVPTRATLTAITAIGTQLWAVGHDGVIVHSVDGGMRWQLQRSDPLKKSEAAGRSGRAASQGAPFLSVLFLDVNNGFAVGGYSLFVGTQDGGKTWTAIDLKSRVEHPASNKTTVSSSDKTSLTFTKEELALDDEADPHLNCIIATGDGSLLIAAERGAAYRSTDHGEHWQKLKLPYDGSMFGAIGFEDKHVLVFGLRGHVYESRSLGDEWSEVKTGTSLSLLGGRGLANDGAILSGANGLLLLRKSGDAAFQILTDTSAGSISAALPVGDAQDFVIAAENGVSRFVPQH